VVGLDAQVLRLSTNKFVYEKLSSNNDMREKIEVLLAEVFGFACAVKIDVTGQGGRPARREDIPEDGLVATALDLGGEIVDE
jgi:hypothetical protein